jgi:hypothetical protein
MSGDVIRLRHVCGCWSEWSADVWAGCPETLARMRAIDCPVCRMRPAIDARVAALLEFYGSPDTALFAVARQLDAETRRQPFWVGVIDCLLNLSCGLGKGRMP